MEISINRSDLQRILSTAVSVADSKGTMPILANVLLKTVGNDTLLVCATDYEISITIEVPCLATHEGSLSVSASDFHKLIRSMRGDTVSIVCKEDTLGIKSGRSKYKLRCMPAEQFPPLPDYSEAEFSEVDPKIFRSMLDRTMVSVCKDTARHHLSGVFFEREENQIRMVSTDGLRLSKTEHLQEGGSKAEGVIIPYKGASELKKILSGTKVAEIAKEPNIIFISIPEIRTVVGVKTLDAQFPDYTQVIPSDNTKMVRFNRGEALRILNSIQFVYTEETGINVEIKDRSMRLFGTNPALGQAEEILDIHYDGDPLSLILNPSMVADYLSKMSGESAVMTFSDAMSPILIHATDDYGYMGVVMPMRVS